MACEWGSVDCKFDGTDKCDTCFSHLQNYKEAPKKKRYSLAHRQNKADGRTGSGFEYDNHKTNTDVLSDKVVSGMTLNSGATVLEKGDEQIRGIVNIMEECKTRVVEQAPGKKTFTIQKGWLDKLHREAIKEKMEFWYLKFSFKEGEKDVYCITEQDIIAAMVKTMVEDRKKANGAAKRIKAEQTRRMSVEADLSAAMAKIQYYEAMKDLMDFIAEEKTK
jgi:hypothetical protein